MEGIVAIFEVILGAEEQITCRLYKVFRDAPSLMCDGTFLWLVIAQRKAELLRQGEARALSIIG